MSSYDGAGNQTVQYFQKDGIEREHVWDGLGWLVAVKQWDPDEDDWAWVMDYDGLGRRIREAQAPDVRTGGHIDALLRDIARTDIRDGYVSQDCVFHGPLGLAFVKAGS